MTAVSSCNEDAETGSKKAGNMIFTKNSGFQGLSFITFRSGRLRAYFSTSGIDRSDELRVLESP